MATFLASRQDAEYFTDDPVVRATPDHRLHSVIPPGWRSKTAARQAGARMLYVAMFDELDEGTAIFKTSADPPVGDCRFVKEPGVPSDHYLRLTGKLGPLIRGEIPVDAVMGD